MKFRQFVPQAWCSTSKGPVSTGNQPATWLLQQQPIRWTQRPTWFIQWESSSGMLVQDHEHICIPAEGSWTQFCWILATNGAQGERGWYGHICQPELSPLLRHFAPAATEEYKIFTYLFTSCVINFDFWQCCRLLNLTHLFETNLKKHC
jgi:hypothetical protein